MQSTIFLASDHAGYELKNIIATHLVNSGADVVDCGPYKYDQDDDYPITISTLTDKMLSTMEGATVGIVVGGSGQGEAIVVNRVKGLRAIVYYGGPLEIVSLGRTHNNANVLSLGARFVSTEDALYAVDTFIETSFDSSSRHGRRVGMIDQ